MLRNTWRKSRNSLVNQVDRKLSDWLPRSVRHLRRKESDSETQCRSDSLNWRLDVRFSKEWMGLFWTNKISSLTRTNLKQKITLFLLELDFLPFSWISLFGSKFVELFHVWVESFYRKKHSLVSCYMRDNKTDCLLLTYL